jgi:hypothetical protein
MGVEKLTKANFWNKIEEKYPEEFKHFSAWIDKYKIECNWNYLFGNFGSTGREIKFHDLPFDMQKGIIQRYQQEINCFGRMDQYQREFKKFTEGITIFFEHEVAYAIKVL